MPLLALGPGPEGDTGATANATLGLTRPQALRLIAAESFARQVTVMPRVEMSSARDRHIAEVAASLRTRLVERRRADAAAGRHRGGDLRDAVRELVDREAAILGAPTARRSPPGSSATASASARSRSCSPTRRSRR